jgi:hypothetical protein
MHTHRFFRGTLRLALFPLFVLGLDSAAAQPNPSPESDSDDRPATPIDRSWRRPLASRNQFPVSLFFVSLAPDNATARANGDTALDIHFDYSNIITGQDNDDEFFYLDLEYLRTDVVIKRGLVQQIEIGASIPFYVYYGGFLDGFVTGLHNFLRLPNFLRGQTDNGQTRYEFVSGDQAPFLGEQSTSDIGDVVVHLKKTMFTSNRYALAARANLKFPTGSPEKLSGSGKTDVGFGLAFDRVTPQWGFYSNANYHFLGQPDAFRVKNFFSFMVGFDYRLKSRLTAHLQYDHARPFVESELPILKEAAQQLALGLRWRYSNRFIYEWRFVEDFSDVSPDFTFGFQVGVRWSRTHQGDSTGKVTLR